MTDQTSLYQLEKKYERGLTSAEILQLLKAHDVVLSEATLRKYVQLGLLPRSVRVGRKGKHQGSQGIYPVGVVRQILCIKEMMSEDFTIEQIQREFFMRGDLEQLERTLKNLFSTLDRVVAERGPGIVSQAASHDVSRARVLSEDLLGVLGGIETRLSSRVAMERAVS